MATVGKFLKALLLGLVSKSKTTYGPSNSRGGSTKRRQIFDEGDFNQDLSRALIADNREDDDLVIAGTDGTFGVFRGQLPDGSLIAVKKFPTSQMKDIQDFSAAANVLGNVRHKNLLRLRGICAEGKERLIVYDYMVNLSLHAQLHGCPSVVLDWSRRMSIAIGAAEGLVHLHHQSMLVHGEIKSHNVLLDVNFEAKWTDFGLMRLMEEGCVLCGGSKDVVEYLAPEYLEGHGPSQKGDVFGFGILLLELISGKKPAEKIGATSNDKSMLEWAKQLMAERRYSELVDPRLDGHYHQDALDMVIYVVTACVQHNASSRPTMIVVAGLLKHEYGC